jgi:hypothetical protein
MEIEKVIAFAQNIGYDNAVFYTKWQGYDVYDVNDPNDADSTIGMPQFILTSGSDIRWADFKEILEIIGLGLGRKKRPRSAAV